MNETWKCPLCSAVVWLPRDDKPAGITDMWEKCKLKQHSAGYECLAFRQPTRSRELLIEKLEGEVRRLESGSMKVVEAFNRERTADVSKARIGKLKAEISKLKAA
jgi:hypothetical protein